MKKIIVIAAVFAVATMAQAEPSKLCGKAAELSVTVARAAKVGVPWDEVEKVKGANTLGENTDAAMMAIARETYYSWSSFDPASIRQLSFMKCMANVPDAMLKDVRAKKAAQ